MYVACAFSSGSVGFPVMFKPSLLLHDAYMHLYNAAQVPVMLPGGTDCRYYRGIGGAVAYGANLLEPSLTFGWVVDALLVGRTRREG